MVTVRLVAVTLHERCGAARFVDRHTIETDHGLTLQADRFIICTGGVSRQLVVPGIEFTSNHSQALGLTEVPASALVGGSGHTGIQVASMCHTMVAGSLVAIAEHCRDIAQPA